MKSRRGDASWDVSASELATAEPKSWASMMVNKALEFGFTPTKIVDNVAIAVGGAAYYGKLLRKYNGDKDKAMLEFVKFTEENQQSADPAKISSLQAGALGRTIFAFANTPFQYTRLM